MTNDKSTMSYFKGIQGVAALFAASALVGCAGFADTDDQSIDDGPVSTSTEPLWISTSITKWGETVPVCFQPGFSSAQQDTIRRAVTDSWGRAAKLEIFGWGACPSPLPAGTVVISVNTNLGPGVLGQTIGLGSPGSGQRPVQFASAAPSQKTIIHEFGHVLGFLHEHFDTNPLTCNQRTSGGDELGTQADLPTSIMSQTACNSASTLSAWDIVGVQNAYGRRVAGSIVGMNAQCVDIPIPFTGAGENLQVFPCSSGTNQSWRMFQDATISAPAFSPSTVDVEGGGSSSGTAIQVFTKNSPVSSNQRWRFNSVEIRGIGNLCLDVPSGSIFTGQIIQTFPCGGGTNQKWNIEWVSGSSTVRVHAAGNSSFCIQAPAGAVAGSDLRLAGCNNADSNEIFSLTTQGELKNQNLCWDSENGNVAPATMQLFTCKPPGNGKRNQQYFLRGNITNDGGACMSTSTTDFKNRDPLQIFGCSGSPDFIWDYYFNP